MYIRKCNRVCERHRSAPRITLYVIAAVALKHLDLNRILNTLGDYLATLQMADGNDRIDEFRTLGILLNIIHKALVHLQQIDGKP